MSEEKKPLGFWSCWSLVVGTMIGSGILLVPTALAPYGLVSFLGWIISAAGAIAIILAFARLASRTKRDGGPYMYVQEAFGDVTGFIVAWAYWISFWASIPVVAIAFVGYLGVFFPAIAQNSVAQALSALALIAALTIVNIRGLKEMSAAQIALTVLKIIPIFVVIGAAFVFGSPSNLPPFHPTQAPLLGSLSAVTLITFFTFTGFEAAVTNVAAVRDAGRTIPRALISGVVLVTSIYLAVSLGVTLLVPPDVLAQSQAPFAEAARAFGPWGPYFIAAGALVATAGTLNGCIFASGQMPMAVAENGRAPAWLAKLNKGGAPYWSLLLSSALGAIVLLMNYSRGMIGAYTFLLMMTAALALIFYFLSAMAELKHSWATSKAWAAVALFAGAFAFFAMIGSGIEVLFWGGVLMAAGAPVYFLIKPRAPLAAPATADQFTGPS